MGCDIHMIVEQKVKTEKHGEVWVAANALTPISIRGLDLPEKTKDANDWPYCYYYRATRRNYSFFKELACVRGDGKYEPRGLPDDVSPLSLAMSEYYGIDGHSHSYLYADEFIPLYIDYHFTEKEKKDYAVDRFGAKDGMMMFKEVMEDHFGIITKEDDDQRNYRFVFFFDN